LPEVLFRRPVKGLPTADHRLIEKVDQRRDGSKDFEEARVEPGAEREIGREFTPGHELLVPEVVGSRMILRVPARHARKLLAGKAADRPRERRRRGNVPVAARAWRGRYAAYS